MLRKARAMANAARDELRRSSARSTPTSSCATSTRATSCASTSSRRWRTRTTARRRRARARRGPGPALRRRRDLTGSPVARRRGSARLHGRDAVEGDQQPRPGRGLHLDEVLTHPAHDGLVLGAVGQVHHAARLATPRAGAAPSPAPAAGAVTTPPRGPSAPRRRARRGCGRCGTIQSCRWPREQAPPVTGAPQLALDPTDAGHLQGDRRPDGRHQAAGERRRGGTPRGCGRRAPRPRSTS